MNAILTSAKDLAHENLTRFPNESDTYRKARNELLVEEIELRRHIERVAEQRRKLPLGGEVTSDYVFIGEKGPVHFANLFGDKDTLVIYSYMFGPQRERPCPMCTSILASVDHKVPDLRQRIAFAVTARSPINRLVAFKKERGWLHLPLYSDTDGAYTRAYVNVEDDDEHAYTVFTRRDGKIYHFWSSELYRISSDPNQDPRGAPDIDPLWNILDTTPEGRGADWYPSLTY